MLPFLHPKKLPFIISLQPRVMIQSLHQRLDGMAEINI